MLNCSISKNHAGIILTGDYWSLKSLNEIIHDINERSPLVRDKEGMFLDFAYDVRKAFECQREILKPPMAAPEFGVRYGVKILWPVILLQYQMLRQSLAFIDHGSRHQAVAYALQFAIENGLAEDFRANEMEIKRAWNGIDLHDPKTFGLLYSRTGLYCSWTKALRKKGISALLDSFSPFYEQHHAFAIRYGSCPPFSPADFAHWESCEWPDIRW